MALMDKDTEAQTALPTQGMHVIRFEGVDGRSVEIEPHEGRGFDVEPLGFVDLVRAAETKNPTLEVVIANGRAPTAATGLELDGPLTATLTLSNNGPVVAYGLVEGGWLPMPWAHKRIAWVDRNVVINLEKLKEEVEHDFRPGDRAWLTKWLGMDVDEVSPILFVLEGAVRRPPTDFEMRAELGRAVKVLQKTLPDARIQSVGSKQRRALHLMALDYAEFRSRAMRVLVKAIPLVMSPVKAERRLALERQVFEVARQEGVKVGSLPILALLSCIYDANPALSAHQTARPGRAVLKPIEGYSMADAYNAMADLYFVELLVNAHALFPQMPPVLYTGDAGLASFWTALQPMTTTMAHLPRGRVRPTVTFGLSGNLFPALSQDELIALKQRLGQ